MLKTKSGKIRLNDISNLVKNVTHCLKPYFGCGAPVSKIKMEIKRKKGNGGKKREEDERLW